MRNNITWRGAGARGLATLMAVVTVLRVAPASGEPADIFDAPAPAIGTPAEKAADIRDGETNVASQTGSFNYSYPINVPPGRNGMQPRLSLTYSSQAPVYGGIATGWNWNLSIPEIREDVAQGRMRTHNPLLEVQQADGKLDDRFVSTLAGGRQLVLVTEPGDPNAYQYRAQGDTTFARYERMKPAAGVPYKWRVYSTDGSIRYFGDSSMKCAGVSDGFAPLVREVDAFENEVTYSWDSKVTGECVISSITWGQNTAANLPSFARVDFAWAVPLVCPNTGQIPGASRDFRSGQLIVTGASRLTTITASAYPPGGSPSNAVHTRTIELRYDLAEESCNTGHAPIKVLQTIDESAVGIDSPLVALPQKSFKYNATTTTLVTPGVTPPNAPWIGSPRPNNLAWGYRHSDGRSPTVEAMMIDIDGDGMLDRLYNTSDQSGHTYQCSAAWMRNKGVNPTTGNLEFATALPLSLPRLKWQGAGGSTVNGATEADRQGVQGAREGCALNGQFTAYRNSQRNDGFCHDGSTCNSATDPDDPAFYCNVNAPNKGTDCSPAGGLDPKPAPFHTYLAYRWMDADGDGLVDLVTAVHGSSNYYDIERGNLIGFTAGEQNQFGIPNVNAWPPCPGPGVGPGAVDRCADTGPITNGVTCDESAGCTTNWSTVGPAVASADHIGCGQAMAKPGPGSGGGGGTPQRTPYARCQGLYPWMIYKNNGNGVFASTPTIKYQPVPLESDSGDSSMGGPGIAATNHAVQDFDGDGTLDAVVHFDANYPHGSAHAWQVWLGDRTGQIGPKRYYYTTRLYPDNRIAGVGLPGTVISQSSAGLIDFNADGIPDHWLNSVNGDAVNVAFGKGIEQDLTAAMKGKVNTPLVGSFAVKPGNDTSFSVTNPSPPSRPILAGTTRTENRVVDVDGDGRPDVVRWNAGNPLVFWNIGGQLTGVEVGYPGAQEGVKRIVEATYISAGEEDKLWELKSDLIDLDGDGIAESVFAAPAGFVRAAPMYTQPPRLMNEVKNGRGAKTSVLYASMHERETSSAWYVTQNPQTVVAGRPKASPNNQWVVRSISTTDDFSPGAATTSYRYKNPVHNSDEDGRFSFRGFEEIVTTGPSGARTIQRYTYTPDWSGRLSTTLVMPKLGSGEGDNDVRTIERSTWMPRTLFGGAVQTFHATRNEHFVCRNTQTEATCTPTAAGGYTSTSSKLTALTSTITGNATPLLWQETLSTLQSGIAQADGDRNTQTTFLVASDVAVYRIHPTGTTKTIQVAGSPVDAAKSVTNWDPSYRVPLSEETWFDTDDAKRAVSSRTYDTNTGNVTSATDARGYVIGYEYDARKLFVAAENQVYQHNLEFVWEYGTGTKLKTIGPQWAPCALTNPITCSPGALQRNENTVRVDGLGRMIERFESVPLDPDQGTYQTKKVETNSYVDAATATVPTSVTHRAAIFESGGTITFAQDLAELDGHGRTFRKTVPGATNGNQVSTFHFNADGTLHDVTLPDPSQDNLSVVQYDYTFDSLGRATSIRRPDSTTATDRSGVNIAYNGVESTTTEFVGAALGQVAATRTTNDSFGRLVKVEEERVLSPLLWAVTLYGYDANDNVSQITDPEGKVTKLAHDYASRRVQIQRINGASTRTWKYVYDKTGNMTGESTPCTGTGCDVSLNYFTSTAYDAFNRPTTRMIAQRNLSDADKDLFGSVQETFEWDLGANGHGELTHWWTNGITSNQPQYQWFVHDAQGRRMMNWQTFNTAGFGAARASMRTFHPGGNPASASYGDYAMGGTVQTVSKVAYDPRGLPSTISISTDNGNTFPTVVTQTRNVAGFVTKRAGNLGAGANKVESNWVYDKLSRVSSQTVQKLTPSLVPVAKQQLVYFGNDDPKTLQQTLGSDPSKTFTYGYDVRHQLTGVTTSTSSFFGATYAYGTAGRFASANENRTGTVPTSDLVTRNVNYVYGGADPEQVTALTNVSGGARFATFTYDEAGNMLSRCMGPTYTPTCTGELLTYLYDGKNQLRRATRRFNNSITGSEEYWYDSDGIRTHVRKLDAAGATSELVWYLDDTEHHLAPTNLPFGAENRVFAHVSLGTPVARVDRTFDNAAPVEYQFHGLASSTLAAVDRTAGTINASLSYAPFGEVLEATDGGSVSNSGLTAHKRKFNDKVQDDLSSLTYYGVRYYDKTLWIWTQADPKYRFAPDAAWLEPRRANLYTASRNNPLRYIDPDGRDAGAAQQALAGFSAGVTAAAVTATEVATTIGAALTGTTAALVGTAAIATIIGVGAVAAAVVVGGAYADGMQEDSPSGSMRVFDLSAARMERQAATAKAETDAFNAGVSDALSKASADKSGGPLARPEPTEARSRGKLCQGTACTEGRSNDAGVDSKDGLRHHSTDPNNPRRTLCRFCRDKEYPPEESEPAAEPHGESPTSEQKTKAPS